MNGNSKHSDSDRELEARLVALVLGEASDFERDELQRLIAERPELATFRERVEEVHDLMQVVGTGELPNWDDEWKLSSRRRDQVLRTLAGEVAHTEAGNVAIADDPANRLAMRVDHLTRSITRIACGVALVAALLLVCAMAFVPRVHTARSVVQVPLTNYYVEDDVTIREAADSHLRGNDLFDFKDPQNRAIDGEALGDRFENNELALKGLKEFDGLSKSPSTNLATVTEPMSEVTESLGRVQEESRRGEVRQRLATNNAQLDDQRFGIVGGGTYRDTDGDGTVLLGKQSAGFYGGYSVSDESKIGPRILIESEGSSFGTSLTPWAWLHSSDSPSTPASDPASPVTHRFSSMARKSEHFEALPMLGQAVVLSEEVGSDYSLAFVPPDVREKDAGDEPFSTFSLHVSDVSFKLAQSALSQGEWPDASQVRIEDFVNAIDYGDPLPHGNERITCSLEQAIHPFLQQRNMLRVAMRTSATGRSNSTPLRLTFLLDNSGSMERVDRQQAVRQAFGLLAQQLNATDQSTLISFARQPRLLADKVGGEQAEELIRLVDNLPSEGGTNFEAALDLAFQKAQEQHLPDAQNRVILLTDGAVNLGDANPDSLSQTITRMRDAGIAFDAAGIGADGLNDEVLEALTRKGDGRYYLLDSVDDADEAFVQQIAGALRPSAKNVKVQVAFNPARVGRYELLGFESHRLNKEDFHNDQVDAAEMAAAEAGVAIYQLEVKPSGVGDVGSVSVRFRDLETGQMVENRWPIPYEPEAPRIDQSSPSLRVATSAALLAAKLQGGPLGDSVELQRLEELLAELPSDKQRVDRVRQLGQMIQQARQLENR